MTTLNVFNQSIQVGSETYNMTVTVRKLERVRTFLGFKKVHAWTDVTIKVDKTIPHHFVGRALVFWLETVLVALQPHHDEIVVVKKNVEEGLFYYLFDYSDVPGSRFGRSNRFLRYQNPNKKHKQLNSRYYYLD